MKVHVLIEINAEHSLVGVWTREKEALAMQEELHREAIDTTLYKDVTVNEEHDSGPQE